MGEFRWLWVAGWQSVVGDQVARVALSVLVFDSTSSAVLTAAVYALTFLPAVLGGVVLGPVADRVPRRRVLVAGDAARACLLLWMAVVVVPWGVLAALVVVVVLIGAPWSAAEAALIADILPGELYTVGLGLRTASGQVAQLAGFAVGVLLTAGPVGVAVGTVLFTRFTSPVRRGLLLGPLATTAGLPLVVCALHPGVLVSSVLWAASGACTAYQVQVVTEFMQTIPAAVRGQGIGLATAGVLAAQGIGLLAGGVVAAGTSPATAVAVAGGCVIVLGGIMTLARSRRH